MQSHGKPNVTVCLLRRVSTVGEGLKTSPIERSWILQCGRVCKDLARSFMDFPQGRKQMKQQSHVKRNKKAKEARTREQGPAQASEKVQKFNFHKPGR